MFLLNKIGFIPIKMCVLQTWVLSHVFNIMKIWWFYSDKIFPNYGPDEKNSAAKLDKTRYHRNWLTAARS